MVQHRDPTYRDLDNELEAAKLIRDRELEFICCTVNNNIPVDVFWNTIDEFWELIDPNWETL